jgi:Platelet-activating factor acetylhydrolase, isoform II
MPSALLLAATIAMLPPPTGRYPVGRVTVEWTDRSRIEPLSADHGFRTLMVDVWYPADMSQGPLAPYLDVAAFERAIGAAGLRRQLEGAYDAVKNGRVQTHAVAAAPFSRSAGRAPVLIFSPGGGMVREVYAAQLEDLASHGFVVAAITHPYDGVVTVYPDGHSIKYDAKRWPQIPSFEGEWNLNQLEWHAKDIRFVLDQLESVNGATSDLPFAHGLDLSRVGAFGHSFGGVAAAKACQTDRRFSACLNQDGLAGWRPFDLDGGAWSKHQRFMLIQRGGDPGPPPDEELARMNITRERLVALVAKLSRDHDTALQRVDAGYEVVLNFAKTSHADFTDLPLLGAGTSEDAEARAHVIATVRSLTLAFFEWSLLGKRPELLQRKLADAPIERIRRFGTAQ